MASVAWDVINILMLDLASSKARVKFKVLPKVWVFFLTRIKLIHVSCLEDRNQVMLNVFYFSVPQEVAMVIQRRRSRKIVIHTTNSHQELLVITPQSLQITLFPSCTRQQICI